MARLIKYSLHLFGDGGAGAATAAGGDGGEAAVATGQLDDGTQVDSRLAARMEAQARRRQARGESPVAAAPMAQQQKNAPEQPAQEPSLEDEWKEAKKGKYRELYGKDVQEAINARFKNQEDANNTLAKLQPMLNALAKQHGIDEGDLDGLSKVILDDDSLYEDEANAAGMTIEGYKTFQKLQQENQRLKQQEEVQQEQQFVLDHLRGLAAQAEELKKVYPNFDLEKELENETFRRLTAPNSGLSVEAAFYAVHHKELEPQAMAYGIQKAKQQISQTMQANRRRPTEGAMQTGQPADISVDPRNWSREDRQKLLERARRGEKIVF